MGRTLSPFKDSISQAKDSQAHLAPPSSAQDTSTQSTASSAHRVKQQLWKCGSNHHSCSSLPAEHSLWLSTLSPYAICNMKHTQVKWKLCNRSKVLSHSQHLQECFPGLLQQYSFTMLSLQPMDLKLWH